MKRKQSWFLITLCIVGSFFIFSGCGADVSQSSKETKMAHNAMSGDIQEETTSEQLPSFLSGENETVKEAYRTALMHHDLITSIPCYCGCGMSAGHENNKDCFIKEIKENGNVVWDSHGMKCYACQQIAMESAKLKAEGKTPLQIRTIIDDLYQNGYGEPTPTPMPAG
ncbi:hypothetical protein IC620_05125 [Hazenella sp. IB182357]|uniref:Lipoprotein n=1 Tax=Polycladospora coralii TaxID=2771432 RepID=A0A926N685_9BACL|nr:PCYCGC motif-containing (lipo)protein [Polycladospora coralii]MBD1371741.1 hypothetical protein [Polycladospora coralii]MBS7529208.1 hypothetical protein [Polycladospora coralii]